MRATSLLAHELLCLHLKCFYGPGSGSPSLAIPPRSAMVKKKPHVPRREKTRTQ
jgi:hypothetical protein